MRVAVTGDDARPALVVTRHGGLHELGIGALHVDQQLHALVQPDSGQQLACELMRELARPRNLEVAFLLGEQDP